MQKFAFRFSIWHFRHKTSVSYILTENLRCKLCWKKVPFSEFNCSVLKQAFFSNWMHQKLFYPTFPLHYPKQKVKLKNVQQRIISLLLLNNSHYFVNIRNIFSDAKCFLHLSLLKRNLSKNSRFIDTDFLVYKRHMCAFFIWKDWI